MPAQARSARRLKNVSLERGPFANRQSAKGTATFLWRSSCGATICKAAISY